MSNLNRKDLQAPPCVWVQAGVLSYRPCHRDFDCESCELFHALRGPVEDREAPGETRPFGTAGEDHRRAKTERVFSDVEGEASALLTQLTEGCDLHLDLPYSPGHFWIKEVAGGEVLLGFDCQTLRILFPVEGFILPGPGVWLKRGEAMGWIQRGHLALPLPAPISGEVLEVNHALVAEIEERGFPASQARWLIRLKPHEPMADIPELFRGQSMLNWYQRKLHLVREYLLNAVNAGVPTGETLNDGGELNRNLEEVLGADSFRELLDRLFQDL